MQIPDELVIFGRPYEVRGLSSVHNMEGVLGLASYREGAIYLAADVDLPLTLSTMWHEAAHIAQQEILGTTDEAQARWIALFVHNFLVSNPQILECYQWALEPEEFEEEEVEDEE